LDGGQKAHHGKVERAVEARGIDAQKITERLAAVDVPVKDAHRTQFGPRFADRAAKCDWVACVCNQRHRGDAAGLQGSTPAARVASLRAIKATENPSAPNFSATAVETPGPKPTMTMVFDMRISSGLRTIVINLSTGNPQKRV
jgi:hypothetical protein